MAITQITPGPFVAGVSSQTSQASIAVTVAAATTIPAGSLVVIYLTCDNAGAAGISAISSVQDTQGNAWDTTHSKVINRTAGSAANDGCTVAIYYCRITKALVAGNTITVNFSPNVTAKCLAGLAFTGANGKHFDSGSASGSGATYSVGPSASLTSGDLICALAGNESNTPPATDSDTTNGSWSVGGALFTGGGGGDATKMAQKSDFKIVTAGGTQTFNAATGATTDWGAVYVAFHVASDVTATPGVAAVTTTTLAPTARIQPSPTPGTKAIATTRYAPVIGLAFIPGTRAVEINAGEARDAFGRTVASSWGTADQGGAYAPASNAALSVGSGVGKMTLNANANVRPTLGLSQTTQDVLVRVSADKLAVGGARTVGPVMRFIDASNYYRGDVIYNADGTVDVLWQRVLAGAFTVISSTVRTALTDSAGAWYWVRGRASGTSPTTLQMKVWADGTAEPSTWSVETTDSSAALQVASGLGVRGGLGAATSNSPVVISWDDLETLTYRPTVTTPRLVTPNVAAITTTRYAPTATATAGVTSVPGVAAVVTTRYAPQLQLAVIPPARTVSTTSYAPTVATPCTVTPGVAAVSITVPTPSVTVTLNVRAIPGLAAITSTTYAPVVSTPRLVTPAVASLATSTYAPAVATPRTATPSPASIATTMLAPVVSTPRTVTPAPAAITTTTYAPAAVLPVLTTPAAAAIASATYAPTVSTPRVVVTGVAALTTSTYPPAVQTPQLVVPGVRSVSSTSYAPDVAVTSGEAVTSTPDVAAVVTTTYAPSIATPRLVMPATRAVVVTRYAPRAIAPRLSTPATRAVTSTTYAPAIRTPRVVTPAAAAIAATRFGPLVLTPRVVTPGRRQLVTTTYAPAVLAGSIRVVPDIATLTSATYAPTIRAAITVTPAPAAIHAVRYAPDIAAIFTRRRGHVRGASALGASAGGTATPRASARATARPIGQNGASVRLLNDVEGEAQ